MIKRTSLYFLALTGFLVACTNPQGNSVNGSSTPTAVKNLSVENTALSTEQPTEVKYMGFVVDDTFEFEYDGNVLEFNELDAGSRRYSLAEVDRSSGAIVEFKEVPPAYVNGEKIFSDALQFYTFSSMSTCPSGVFYCIFLQEKLYGRSFEVDLSPNEGLATLDKETIEKFLFSIGIVHGMSPVGMGGESYGDIIMSDIFRNLAYHDPTEGIAEDAPASIEILDQENYYLTFKTAKGEEGVMTVFVYSNGSPLVAIEWGSQVYFLKEVVGDNKDVSMVVLPTEIAEKDRGDFYFELPRYGTDLIVKDAATKEVLYVLKWKGDRFSF